MLKYDELLRLMMERRALEVHMVPGSPIMLRERGGQLTNVDASLLTPGDTKKFVSDIMTPEQRAEFAQKNEIDFAYSVPGLSRYRINIFMQRNSISLVIKTVPPQPPTFEELGLPEIFKSLAMKATKGLIMLCGAKGSGKSSTLAAMINYILENRTCKIVTIENPIKFLFKNKKGIICQRELGVDCKDFDSAFASLPLLGADIIILNDIESFAVAHKILTLAAGGQLVFVTAIAPNVQIILEKIIDFYPSNLQSQCKTLLSVGLEAVVAQCLVKKATGDGVFPACEVLIATGPVKANLKDGKIFQLQSIMSTQGRESGMSTQEQALRTLVKKNLITQEEAYEKAVRPEEFRKIMALPF
jgi:twitching motility protein PilT